MSDSDASDDVRQAAAARVGQVLRGKWRLERLLGVGGMASVYAAVHRNGLRGAVKMLHPTLSTLAQARERFLREGYAANTVGHEGAVRVLDDDVTDDDGVFLVMELLDGQSLEELAQRHAFRLTPSEVAAIGDQLLDVLAAAHEKRIWHRDLKPENLFLTQRGVVKVLDFGIAKIKQDGQSSRATSTGSLMGTPAFMPPEQALGKWSLVDGRSDLWAVGATLLNLLTGQYLHKGETTTEMLVAAATSPAPPVRTLDASMPEALAAVLDRALAFRIDERWPDARSMQAALRAACGPGDLSRLLTTIDAPATGVSKPPQTSETRLANESESAPALPFVAPADRQPAATCALPESNSWPLATESPVSRSVRPSRRSMLGWIVGIAAAILLLLPALAFLALHSREPTEPATLTSAVPSIRAEEEPEPSAVAVKASRSAAPAEPPPRRPTPKAAPPAPSAKPTSKMIQKW